MCIQVKSFFTTKTASNWYRLVLVLSIVALLLAGCGGGGGAGDSQQTGGDTLDTSLSAIDAVDKGTLEYDVAADDTIAAAEAHSYQFTGTSGENLLIRINATGSTFNAPYVFLYGPDEALIANMNTENSSRSKRLEQTLEADGTYTIVVRPVNDVGAGDYSVTVELQEE